MREANDIITKLRQAIDGATQGEWEWRGGYLKGPFTSEENDYYGSNNVVSINYAAQCPHLVVKEPNARHISTFDPPTARLLVDVVEAAERFVPDPATVQLERREVALRDSLAALREHMGRKLP